MGAAGTPWWLRHSCHPTRLASQLARPSRHNSVHECLRTMPRSRFCQSVYTPLSPRPVAHRAGPRVPRHRRPHGPVMLAQVLGPDTYATRAVTQPPTRTHFIVAGHRIPSRPQLASGGDPGDGSRRVWHGGASPVSDVSAKVRDRARREGCHATQTPDTYQPYATASCHAWGPAYT